LTTETAPGRRKAIVLSGSGRFADAWHPFPRTSACLAEIIQADGFEVEVASVDDQMAHLDRADLVAINIGAPAKPDSRLDAEGRAGLLRYLGRGGPLLVMHVSATSLPAIPEWESIMGGIWVRGTTMHPDYGPSRVHVRSGQHAIVQNVTDFTLTDERYSYLRVADDVTILATHAHDAIEHPILWARSYELPARERAALDAETSTSRARPGDAPRARIVYDALGHDERSYESPEHRQIIAASVRWLAGELAGAQRVAGP
jgi:type 1 glutamine amidotransferase